MYGTPPPLLTGISLDRLRTFCAIVKDGSIVAAAKGDPNKQSLYSRQVREIEEFLGVKVFDRVGKSLQLTEIGRRLAVVAEGFFGALSDVVAVASGAADAVSIGAGESVLRWLLLPHVSELASAFPKSIFNLRTFPTEKAVRAVEDGSIDMAIVREDAVTESLKTLGAGVMDYCLVVPRTLLPGRSAAGFKMAKSIPFAVLAGEGALARQVTALANDNGYSISVRLKLENFTLLIEAMENGDFASVLPITAASRLSQERFAIVEIPGIEKLRRKLVVAIEPRSAALRENVRRAAQRVAKLLSTQRNPKLATE
jgi:DNA-binding transcriptional LysR family regulator